MNEITKNLKKLGWSDALIKHYMTEKIEDKEKITDIQNKKDYFDSSTVVFTMSQDNNVKF